MNSEKQFQDILTSADKHAVCPEFNAGSVIQAVQHRLNRRKQHRRAWIGAAAAAAVCLAICIGYHHQLLQRQREVARLKQDIERVNQRLDQTLALIQETLADHRSRERLASLEKELSSLNQNRYDWGSQRELTAQSFLMDARRLEEARRFDSARESYQRILNLYPQTPSAETARQKLQELQTNQIGKDSI